uniref:MRH domain-containing protein n=1 Tax=Octactis speculum TaxID=3111310 RepID=A0A7S2AW44_9STRA|mmetsp:Transcript_16568/g.22246  ORF Transcript_16568/g.22246 Transcript_16568/m.22246 type:complete len:170 (+) Transcript_16568:959-1468(+)
MKQTPKLGQASVAFNSSSSISSSSSSNTSNTTRESSPVVVEKKSSKGKKKKKKKKASADNYDDIVVPRHERIPDPITLGLWHSWGRNRSVMYFRQGEKCVDGPDRSVNVTVICGTQNEVLRLDEDGMCIYSMLFRTPAACDQQKAQLYRDNATALGIRLNERHASFRAS